MNSILLKSCLHLCSHACSFLVSYAPPFASKAIIEYFRVNEGEVGSIEEDSAFKNSRPAPAHE